LRAPDNIAMARERDLRLRAPDNIAATFRRGAGAHGASYHGPTTCANRTGHGS